MTKYPLQKLVQLPKLEYVPSWAQDTNSLRETFKRARRNVGKPTRVHVGRCVFGKMEIRTTL